MGYNKKLLESKSSGWVGKARRSSASRQVADRVISDLPNNELPEVVLADTMYSTMRAFVSISEEKLKRSILHRKVIHSADLLESLRGTARKAPAKTFGNLSFLFYGRFPDMGVGKGVTLLERQTGRALTNERNPGQIRRRPKPWFTEVWGHERHRLAEVVTRDMARAAAENLHDILPQGTLELTV